jgi:hypothetical protein
VRWAGLKGAERALEKAVRCYGGDVSRLCDVVRQVALLLHGGGGGGGDQIVAAVRKRRLISESIRAPFSFGSARVPFLRRIHPYRPLANSLVWISAQFSGSDESDPLCATPTPFI